MVRKSKMKEKNITNFTTLTIYLFLDTNEYTNEYSLMNTTCNWLDISFYFYQVISKNMGNYDDDETPPHKIPPTRCNDSSF